MSLRMLLATVALFAASVPTSQPAFSSPNDLMIVTRDQSLQRAMQLAYVEPFVAVTGFSVQQQVWGGGIDTLRTQVKTADNNWDLVLVDADELSVGCGEGLFEKLDWSAIGGKDHYAAQAFSECGLGAVTLATVLAWDKDKLPVVPSWSDFWDVAKYPGKRGLRKGVRGNLEFALMADGVSPGDVYKTLATADGVDRAFRKLDQLKPYVVWWSSEEEAGHILASGDVLMTSAPSGQVTAMAEQEHRNFGLQFAGGLLESDNWVIIKGSPSLRTAQQFLYFTGLPAVETRLLQRSGAAGMAKGLNDGLSPELAAVSPSNANNVAAGLKLDSGFWHDNMAKLRQRFDAWQTH